ncbi:MAG TPA: T9SS type A sorting domain-containing protein, partial [Chitinophagales bacterium]|nr:T9SS type A sorting domain-containing protein [Chitinophagales bacterium]
GVRNSSYEIQLTPQGSGSPYMYGGPITGTPVNRTITCLPSSTFFTYQIREQCGVNKYSDWVKGFSTYTSPRCTAPDGQAGTIVNTQNANLSWNSLYTNETSKPYQISYGVGITSAEQGTLTPVTTITPGQVSGTTRTHALNVASGVGNVTWFVREVCGLCDTTVWSGPHTLPAATCNVPNVNNMSTSSITTTSAIVSWLSTSYGATAVIELHDQTTGAYSYYNVGTGVGYSRTATLSGLFANTVYNWRVKEYCTTGDSTAYSVPKQFTTPGGGNNTCVAPINQGIFVTSGNVLIVKWESGLYLDGSKSYEIAAGMNITSPAQATIQQSSGYYRTQSPTFPTHFFANGNAPGFTWFVRDVCSPGNYSAWLGPYVMGSSSKTDETGVTAINEAPVNDVEFKLYPNPNNGTALHIKTNMGGSAALTIYNLQGQLVAQQLLNADGITNIDVSALADAVYTCHITNGQHTKAVRLVIQR